MVEKEKSPKKKKSATIANGRILKKDLIKDVILILVATILGFAYFMVMLLIISFVAMSVIHFTIEGMVLVSVAAAVILFAVMVFRTIRKYKKML